MSIDGRRMAVHGESPIWMTNQGLTGTRKFSLPVQAQQRYVLREFINRCPTQASDEQQRAKQPSSESKEKSDGVGSDVASSGSTTA